MKVESMRIGELRIEKYNPRIMSSREMGKLKKSIREFGMVEPVVINSDNTVIGGHQRVKAARELGWDAVPIVRVNLTKKQERVLNLALNRIRGIWDYEKLGQVLKELGDDAMSIGLTGFDMGELEAISEIYGDLPESEPEFDEGIETKNRCPKCGYEW